MLQYLGKQNRYNLRAQAHTVQTIHALSNDWAVFPSDRRCVKTARINNAIIPKPESNWRPPEKLPVRSLIAPIAYVSTNPERLPRELINAMPAAVAVGAKNLGAKVQKIVIAELTPKAETLNNASLSKGDPTNVDAARPIAANASGSRRWKRRSASRSERLPHHIIPTIATAKGMALTNPVCTMLKPNCSTIWGKKKMVRQ